MSALNFRMNRNSKIRNTFHPLAESGGRVNHPQLMKVGLSLFVVIALLPIASAQEHVVYAEPAGPLHTLDVYAMPKAKHAPVMFWIHGGGWETGDKSDVAQK